MFETTLTPAALDEASTGEPLRVPAWDEMVARLAAARDLRRALHGTGSTRSGSFARFATQKGPEVNGKADSINPNGLAHGKAAQGMVAAAANGAVSADRETR